MKHRRMTISKLCLVAVALSSLTLVGCIYEVGLPAGEEQFGRLVPIQGMHQQTFFKDQSSQPIYRDDQPEGMRQPPPNTVAMDQNPRGDRPDRDHYRNLENPVPVTEQNLEYGRFRYEEQCAVCHGLEGHGTGPIVEAGHYQATVPTFHTTPQRNQTDGDIYRTITYGAGMMWSYENQLTDMERWAVVNYIRALQRSEYPQPRDVERVRSE